MKTIIFSILMAGMMAQAWAQELYDYKTPRESQDWCTISIKTKPSDGPDLPLVLLIGDSITVRYSSEVGAALKNKAYVSLLGTSKAVGDPALLDEIKLVLRQNKYAVIHFNYGLHGGIEGFRNGFSDVIAMFRSYAPNSKLIWGTTTPRRQKDGVPDKGVQDRNKIAAEHIAKAGISTDNLYDLVANHAKDLWDGGGVHFTAEGTALQSKQVAQHIESLLPKPITGPAKDLATPPALPNLSPGPEYADKVRKYQGVPGLERAANGRLWAAWYTGGRDEDRQNYVILNTSSDDGKSWQTVLVLDPDGDGPLRAWDPCLWHDPTGKLWVFWSQERMGPITMGDNNKRGIATIATFAITTTDSGKASPEWTKPRLISHGVMLNKPTVTTKGQWLMPIATWGNRLSDRVLTSSDKGATFTELGATGTPDVNARAADEHIIIERKDGSLWMLVRGNFQREQKPASYIGESVSKDGGKSWTDVTPSTIPHPVARFCIRRLASGKLLLIRNNPPDGKTRSHLTAFLSEDDGATWKGGLLIDERDQVSYPDLVQAGDGSVYLIYDRERKGAREILMAVFKEQEVMEGKISSDQSRLRVLVNRATGDRYPK